MPASRLGSCAGALLPALLSLLISTLPAAASPGAPAEAPPRRNSLEARLSWGVTAAGASRAYRKGATGQGVVVAMIDTGLTAAKLDMFSHLSPHFTDLVANRRLDDGDRAHGEQVASLLAARVDGAGTFGIAFGATLLPIRADSDGSCLRVCAFDPAVLAEAIDYAVDRGARVIGLPVAAQRPIPAIEPALARAVASGAVIVAAAGNDGGNQPVWPARYAADPRFGASMIVAGASTPRGRPATWTNRAGATENRYLVAPGQQVIVGCTTRTCRLTSGTSYSVAYAAGALAVLLSRAPELSTSDAAALLLDNANDLASRGPDAATGRGRLDVDRALRALDR